MDVVTHPTDATGVERAPVAPPVAQPPAAEKRPPAGGKEVSGPGRRGPAPLTSPLLITVIGRPAPQGSKSSTLHKQSRRIVTMESSSRVKPWREAVKGAALPVIEADQWPRLDGPVQLEVVFCFDPPKSAPKRRRIWPITRSTGDLDKLLRSTFDALTDAGAFRDDSQIVSVLARKAHTNDHDAPLAIPGAVIAITEVTS